jgi:hypothetical protein
MPKISLVEGGNSWSGWVTAARFGLGVCPFKDGGGTTDRLSARFPGTRKGGPLFGQGGSRNCSLSQPPKELVDAAAGEQQRIWAIGWEWWVMRVAEIR